MQNSNNNKETPNNNKETPNKQLISKKPAAITRNITRTEQPFSASDAHPEFDEAFFYVVLAIVGICVLSFLYGIYSPNIPESLSSVMESGAAKDTTSTIWKMIKTLFKKIF